MSDPIGMYREQARIERLEARIRELEGQLKAVDTMLAEEMKRAESAEQRLEKVEKLLRETIPVMEAAKVFFDADARLWPAWNRQIKPLIAQIKALS